MRIQFRVSCLRNFFRLSINTSNVLLVGKTQAIIGSFPMQILSRILIIRSNYNSI